MKLRIKELLAGWMHGWTPKRSLLLILILGLIHGLIYVFAIPPWWHYDEAGHFETAWLIGNQGRLPTPGDYDEGLQRRIATSMLKSGWYRNQNYTPDLTSAEPVWIGNITAIEPPAYYLLPALFMRAFGQTNIDLQLYAMRLYSLALFLLSLFLAWKIMQELFGPDHPLTWSVPVFMALLPGYVDIMTSANNDAGAAVVFTLFLWLSVRLLKRKFSLLGLLWLVLATGLCLLTKRTTWVAIGLLPLVVLFSVLRGRGRKYFWAAILFLGLAGLVLAFNWGDAAEWYQVSDRPDLTRTEAANAPSGKFVFQVNSGDNIIGQFIDPYTSNVLRGQQVTLGVWMWATNPTQSDLPIVRFAPGNAVDDFVDSPAQTVQLTTQPVFYTTTMVVSDKASRGWIMVSPGEAEGTDATIYYDDFTLAPGDFDTLPPAFKDASHLQGTWDGQSIENLIRNGSGESGWLTVRPWTATITKDVPGLFGKVPLILASLQDRHGIGWFYDATAGRLSNTFWSQVASNKVNLPGRYSQIFLRLITGLGLLGALLWGWRNRRHLAMDIIFVMGLASLIIWALDFIRGSSELLDTTTTITWARYAMPAILPTALVFCAGWLELLTLLKKWSGLSDFSAHVLLPVFMLGLDLYTFLAISMYFYPKLVDVAYLAIFIGLTLFLFMGLILGKQNFDRAFKQE